MHFHHAARLPHRSPRRHGAPPKPTDMHLHSVLGMVQCISVLLNGRQSISWSARSSSEAYSNESLLCCMLLPPRRRGAPSKHTVMHFASTERPQEQSRGRHGAPSRHTAMRLIMLHAIDHLVGAELLRSIPQCISVLLNGRQSDRVVGTERLRGIQKCLTGLLHADDQLVGTELPRSIRTASTSCCTAATAITSSERSSSGHKAMPINPEARPSSRTRGRRRAGPRPP
jgi:cellobiose-specific phosphotransferase system component IIA